MSTLKYIFTTISLVVGIAMSAGAQGVADTGSVLVDSTATADTVHIARKVDSASHQLTLGIDIIRPIENAFMKDQSGYEFAAEYYLHNEIYLVAEGGWGKANVDYTDLKYSTSNIFYRVGMNKILIPRENKTDWGGMFMGLRLAAANIKRSGASYTVIDSLWGNGFGTLPPKNLTTVWMELTGGVRVELYKGLMAGWNIRGKFLLNGKQIQDLSPLYIAGYGRGDKSAVFDFNFYLSYAIRWKKKYLLPQKPDKVTAAPGNNIENH